MPAMWKSDSLSMVEAACIQDPVTCPTGACTTAVAQVACPPRQAEYRLRSSSGCYRPGKPCVSKKCADPSSSLSRRDGQPARQSEIAVGRPARCLAHIAASVKFRPSGQNRHIIWCPCLSAGAASFMFSPVPLSKATGDKMDRKVPHRVTSPG